MKLLKTTFLLLVALFFTSCKTEKKDALTEKITAKNSQIETIKIKPVNHGTLVIESKNYTFYIDPVGGAEKFEAYESPDFVLITDIHGDHLNIKTLENLNLSDATLIAPKAVTDKLPKDIAKIVATLPNDSKMSPKDIVIETVPMYNLREEALKFHTKGRGNGYIITVDEQRIYISGDTEDIPEMRNLEAIDIAFVCMNLPYTMTEQSAASAVLDFKPKKVYPYHYRGTNGLSDVNAFKSMIKDENSDIEVVLLDWY